MPGIVLGIRHRVAGRIRTVQAILELSVQCHRQVSKLWHMVRQSGVTGAHRKGPNLDLCQEGFFSASTHLWLVLLSLALHGGWPARLTIMLACVSIPSISPPHIPWLSLPVSVYCFFLSLEKFLRFYQNDKAWLCISFLFSSLHKLFFWTLPFSSSLWDFFPQPTC